MGHKLGQVFLKDKNILNKIIQESDIQSEDHVLEIGCGEGILTHSLSEKTPHLHVVEIDPTCIERTKDNVENTSVTYHLSDILTFDWDLLGESSQKVVANIPYYISAKIIKTFIQEKVRIQQAIIMVQHEFADKLVATPGTKSYTSLTLYTQFYFNVKYLFKVSRNSFFPIPKVDSAVLLLTPKSAPFQVNEDEFFDMIRSSFWARRKTLKTALAQSPFITLDKVFKDCDFFKKNPQIRGERLTLSEFYDLYQQISCYFIKNPLQ